MDAKAPVISLCIITKDEEDWIEQCIRSVQPIVSEVIIVDTGSTDRTLEIAQALGATIYHRPWDNDFSAPRNLSLEKAKGDWILVLDADEAIAAQDHERLLKLTKEPNIGWLLTQRHYSNDARLSGIVPCKGEFPEWERGVGAYFESSLVRFFPNRRGIHYQGRVHELVEHSIAKIPGLTVKSSGIRIHHYGHTEKVQAKKKKSKLYTPLGQSKVQEDAGNWQAFFELGVEHNINGKRDESIQAFMRALEMNPKYVPCWVNLGYVLCETARYQEAAEALDTAIKLDPNEPEAYCNLGVVFMRVRHFDRAAVCFSKAVQLKPDYVLSLCNLGECLIYLGQLGQAVPHFKKALEYFPNCAQAKFDLGVVYFTAGRVKEAEQYFRAALQDSPQHSRALYYLGQVLRLGDRLEEAADCLQRFCQIDGTKEPDLVKNVEHQLAGIRRAI